MIWVKLIICLLVDTMVGFAISFSVVSTSRILSLPDWLLILVWGLIISIAIFTRPN